MAPRGKGSPGQISWVIGRGLRHVGAGGWWRSRDRGRRRSARGWRRRRRVPSQGTDWAVVGEVRHEGVVAALHGEPPGVLVPGDRHGLRRQVAPHRAGDGGTARRGRGRALRRSFERSKVAGSCGSGTSSPNAAKRANSRRRPSRVASAMSGSMWSVKNWNGAVSPYSSPMNSIGVNGDSRTHSAASGRTSAGSRSPNARLPTWSWFWSNTTNCVRRPVLAGRAVTAAAVRRVRRRRRRRAARTPWPAARPCRSRRTSRRSRR